MADFSLFFSIVRWFVVSPFKFSWLIITTLFKLKLRHTFVGIFLIVMFVSSIGEAVQHKNISYLPLGMGRVILGADQSISKTIIELANADKITWAGHSWFIFNMIGSIYLIGYIIFYMHTFFSYFNKDMPIVLTIIIYLMLFFCLKMLYLTWEGAITQEPYDLTKASNWANAIPFKFIYDFTVNFDKLYNKVEPTITAVKNLTEPYAGLLANNTGDLNAS